MNLEGQNSFPIFVILNTYLLTKKKKMNFVILSIIKL